MDMKPNPKHLRKATKDIKATKELLKRRLRSNTTNKQAEIAKLHENS
jgi:hypothetical protein